MKKYYLIATLFLICTDIYGQQFTVSPFITIQGNNKNINIISTDVRDNYSKDSFICWENHLDSLYTIYLKRIDSLSDRIEVVCSNTNQNINPSVSYYNNGIRVVWQSFRNNHWVLYSRDYQNGSFSDIQLLTDTTVNNITPSINEYNSVWIQEGRLVCNFYLSQLAIVDSNNCSNPKLLQGFVNPVILYEKGNPPNTQIKLAEFLGWAQEDKPYWRITQISDSGYNISPSFGTNNNISYQTLKDNKWQVVYSYYPFNYEYNKIFKTNNTACNYEHPIVFSYFPPTFKSSKIINPLSYFDGHFLAYESDSLLNNKEIFINYKALHLYGYSKDTILNISNTQGEDVKPYIAILRPSTIPKVGRLCILWEHTENDKTDIWWAVTTYKFPTDVEEESINKTDFILAQNYPNPFNSSTIIKFSVPIKLSNQHTSLNVYDINGQLVKQLLNENLPSGNYLTHWDGTNINGITVTSGVYFYNLNIGGNQISGKMSLIK